VSGAHLGPVKLECESGPSTANNSEEDQIENIASPTVASHLLHIFVYIYKYNTQYNIQICIYIQIYVVNEYIYVYMCVCVCVLVTNSLKLTTTRESTNCVAAR
jgi:hypothetical protein